MYHQRSGFNMWLCTCLFSSIFLFSNSFSLSYAQLEDNLESSQPSIIDIALLDMTLTASSTGLTSVIGTVINNSTENVENIKVNVVLFDSDNSEIRETSRFVTGPFTVYEPGSTEGFNFLMSVEEFDHYNATAYAERVQ